MTWLPHVTVAAVIPRNGQFLMVKERSDIGDLVINQPAGHLESGETLIEAVVREALEETGWHVEPEALLGFNLYTAPANGITYFRCNFLAKPIEKNDQAVIDKDICEVIWISETELRQQISQLRSPMVLKAIDNFNSGIRYPLSLLQNN